MKFRGVFALVAREKLACGSRRAADRARKVNCQGAAVNSDVVYSIPEYRWDFKTSFCPFGRGVARGRGERVRGDAQFTVRRVSRVRRV